MATAPELLATPEVVIRAMRGSDVADVVAIERASYQFPWSEGIFRDCLRVGYVCRVITVSRHVMAYGVMSLGAGEAHILNLCVAEGYRCRRGRRRRVSRGGPRTPRRSGCTLRSDSSRPACGAATIRRSTAVRTPPFSGV